MPVVDVNAKGSKVTRPKKARKATEIKKASVYSEQDIDRALVAVALRSGNVKKATADLHAVGLKVNYSTVLGWANRAYVERYEALRAEVVPRIKEQTAELHTALAERNIKMEGLLLSRLESEAKDLPIRDVPGAARNAAVSSGVHTDKALALRADPRIVESSATFEEVVRALNAIEGVAVKVVHEPEPIDVEAEEAPEF